MTSREKLAALIAQIPENNLQLALEWLVPLAKASSALGEEKHTEPETIEFVIHDSPTRQTRLPIRLVGSRQRVVMETGSVSEKHLAAINALSENARWWITHRLEVIAQYRNTHIAISQGEIFAGKSYFDALSRANVRRPGDTPFVIRLSNSDQAAVDAN